MEDYAIEMIGIVKEFSNIRACDNVTLQLRRGEILSLLGENGAGKTTLMNILFGLYKLDKGIIKIYGEEVQITNPNIATGLGIGMVHQHFKLVETFSVSENIILGLEPHKGFMLDMENAIQKIIELSEKFGLNVNPYSKIEEISVGMQQRVEILKMLYRDAEILIFDEPTSVLTPIETVELIKIMRNLVNKGKSIIFISHKLKEIKEVADRCTVMRRGKIIDTVEVSKTTEKELAEMMVGHEISFKVDKCQKKPGNTILEVKDLYVNSKQHEEKASAVNGVSFSIRQGEILGLAGVDGSGQTELVEALIGLRKVKSGNILLSEIDITNTKIFDRINRGVSHIPEDRQKYGLVLDYSIEDNLVLATVTKHPFSNNGLLNRKEIQKNAEMIVNNFDVRSFGGTTEKALSLSGGNQQKVILGREIEMDPDLLIAVQPTRGLDVGAIEYIHKRIIEQRDHGKAIFLVSLELDEILKLSDRIIVINNGSIVGEVLTSNANENDIGVMMMGLNNRGIN